MASRIRKSTLLSMSFGGVCMYTLWALTGGPHAVDLSILQSLEQLQLSASTEPSTFPSSVLQAAMFTKSEHGMYYFDDSAYAHSRLGGPGRTNVPRYRHPIVDLIGNATRSWRHKLDKESKTLAEGVAEYKRRYGRPPPKGFDLWWQWAQESGVVLKDEYDFLYTKIEPFFALPPQVFKERSERVMNGSWGHAEAIFAMSIKDGVVKLKNPYRVGGERTSDVFDAIDLIASGLPDMDVPIISHDMPSLAVSGPNRERHIAHARSHTSHVQSAAIMTKAAVLPPDSVNARMHQPGLDSFPNMCSPDSTWRKVIDGVEDVVTSVRSKAGYIGYEDHTAAMDFCEHPDLNELHGYLAQGHPIMGPYHPVLGFDTAHGYGDIPMATFSQYDIAMGEDPDWADKIHSQLAWRGSVTGSSYRFHRKWRSNQRLRLVNRTGPKGSGYRTVRWASNDEKGGNDSLEYFQATASELAHRYYDIQLTGKPIQCQDVICDAMVRMYDFSTKRVSPAQMNQYKYLIDVDGNGWSGRFFRLMSSKSAILKSTIIPEWYADRIQPWYHYIPVRLDYHDLDDIMAFFTGDLEGRGAHDEMGEQIGSNGAEWAKTFWRPEDISAYMFRVLLEYARLLHRNPNNLESMDYEG